MIRSLLLAFGIFSATILLGEPEHTEIPIQTPSFATSAKRAEVDPARIPWLIDLANMRSAPAEDPNNLKPMRLYKRFEPGIVKKDGSKGSWCFDLTDKNSKFPKPPRCLSPAPEDFKRDLPCTIPGSWAGGKNDETWFQFEYEAAEMKSWLEITVGKNPNAEGVYYTDYIGKGRGMGRVPHTTLVKP